MTADALTELPAIARSLMRDANARWWLVGGVALAVAVGRSWRDHDDLDIATLRPDALDAHLDRLRETGLLVAVDGGRRYVCASSERRLTVEFVVSTGDATCWVYRHDPALRVEWSQAVLHSAAGVPYLAPELVLLSKSRSLRPRDEVDLREVIPALHEHRRAFLASRLAPDHPWHGVLGS